MPKQNNEATRNWIVYCALLFAFMFVGIISTIVEAARAEKCTFGVKPAVKLWPFRIEDDMPNSLSKAEST